MTQLFMDPLSACHQSCCPTIYLCVCSLTLSRVSRINIQGSPDSVWHSVGLVAVALAVAGVLRAAGGPMVPPQSHGPVGEHRDALGDTPAGLEGGTMRAGDVFRGSGK